MARHRRAYGRRSHGGGLMGAVHGLVGVVAVAGLVVASWHIATDPATVAYSAPSARPAVVASPRATARPTARPRATAKPAATVHPESAETVAQCLEGIGLDAYTVELEGTDPAEYGC